MQKVESPLEPILAEIEKALSAELYYLALATVFTLPDICVSLVSDDGRSSGPRYEAWCDENLTGDEFSFVTGRDFYSMRCGVSHNGRYGDLKHNVKGVAFAMPQSGNLVVNAVNNIYGDVYYYSAVQFCRNVMDRVRKWYDEN